MDKPLLDKLPRAEGQRTSIEEYWTQDEIAIVVGDIANLGHQLQNVSLRARSHHEDGNLKMARGEIALVLLRIHETLMPIYGADVLWPLGRALDTFHEAQNEKRHWLVTFKGDAPHLPRHAPCRDVLRAYAAAVLDYFDDFQTDLGMNQGTIAAHIAEAMTAGGFRVRPGRGDKPLRGRTVQDWRILLASGKLPGRVKRRPANVGAFQGYLKLLSTGRGDKAALPYFNELLADLRKDCRDLREVFAHDRDVAARKS